GRALVEVQVHLRQRRQVRLPGVPLAAARRVAVGRVGAVAIQVDGRRAPVLRIIAADRGDRLGAHDSAPLDFEVVAGDGDAVAGFDGHAADGILAVVGLDRPDFSLEIVPADGGDDDRVQARAARDRDRVAAAGDVGVGLVEVVAGDGGAALDGG